MSDHNPDAPSLDAATNRYRIPSLEHRMDMLLYGDTFYPRSARPPSPTADAVARLLGVKVHAHQRAFLDTLAAGEHIETRQVPHVGDVTVSVDERGYVTAVDMRRHLPSAASDPTTTLAYDPRRPWARTIPSITDETVAVLAPRFRHDGPLPWSNTETCRAALRKIIDGRPEFPPVHRALRGVRGWQEVPMALDALVWPHDRHTVVADQALAQFVDKPVTWAQGGPVVGRVTAARDTPVGVECTVTWNDGVDVITGMPGQGGGYSLR